MALTSFIRQGYEILYANPEMVQLVADVARGCYRSWPKGESYEKRRESNENLVRHLIKNHHDAMLEHSFLSVRFLTNRAIANEIERHRSLPEDDGSHLAERLSQPRKFAQESTRYVNYENRGFEMILREDLTEAQNEVLKDSFKSDVEHYCQLLLMGTKPQDARDALPLDLAARVTVSGDFSAWRHFFQLRTGPTAHPQMRALVTPLLHELQEGIPVVFDDIGAEGGGDGRPR